MGIDIYARWKNQTPKQVQEQFTGFSAVHGHVGYLREAYRGNPYATYYMFQEVFSKKGEENKYVQDYIVSMYKFFKTCYAQARRKSEEKSKAKSEYAFGNV